MSSSLGLTMDTALGKEQLKNLNSIISTIWENPDSFEFRVPVDFKEALGLLDYPTLIKNPMDLGTLKKNLAKNKYKFVEEVLNDAQLIWDNCKLYNAEGSWIYKLAEKLEKLMRRSIKNFFPQLNLKPIVSMKQHQMGGDLNQQSIFQEYEQQEEVSYQDRLKFSQNVKFLTTSQLGIIVDIIQTECPDAFKETDKDKYSIIVDNIPFDTFQKLQDQVNVWINISNDHAQKKVKL